MRIGDLSTRTGVSVRSLRYYEEQGLLDPSRTSAGQRAYTAQDQDAVAQIQKLFRAGFCSSVIRDLLPALAAPITDADRLAAAFDAAATRLDSERESIEAELAALRRLRTEVGLAADTRVRVQSEEHDSSSAAPAAPCDHRNRRLR